MEAASSSTSIPEVLFHRLSQLLTQDLKEFGFFLSQEGVEDKVLNTSLKEELNREKLLQFAFKLEEEEIPDSGAASPPSKALSLGLAFWAIPFLFKFAHQTFFLLRKKKMGNGSLCGDEEEMYLRSTAVILLINADCYSVWNERKKLLLNSKITLAQEMKFVNLVFSKHPKSSESWAHRKWLLREHLSRPSTLSKDVLAAEFQLCDRLAEVYPKNYYAWTYRGLLLQFADEQIINLELLHNITWIRKHISDHSALHYRFLLLHNLKTAKRELVQDQVLKEFIFIDRMISLYPGHECFWCYRKALVHFWFISICRSKKGGQQQREKVADRPEQDSVDIEAYIEQITESSIEDVFSCFAHQQRLATERIGTLLHSALFTSHCLNDYECSRTHLHHKLAGSHMLWLRWIEERLQELHSNEETSNSVTCSSCVSLSSDDFDEFPEYRYFHPLCSLLSSSSTPS